MEIVWSSMTKLSLLKWLNSKLGSAITVSIFLLIVSHYFGSKLPAIERITYDIENSSPQQNLATKDPFELKYEGDTYVIEPLAEYQIAGLVVTHNHIIPWFELSRNEHSVNIKDICIIWGDNVKSENYREISYWSGPWTCHIKPKSQRAFQEFHPHQLSNNHLLSDDPEVLEKINQIQLGDQVFLEGYLVNYHPKNMPQYNRRSSLIREDSGDGACEVLYVKHLKIIKKGHPFWQSLKETLPPLIAWLVTLKLILFCCIPHLSLRRPPSVN